MLTVLENCRVSPPPGTVGDRSLSLTFFDMIWLTRPMFQEVSFYEFRHSREHFLETIVPQLKHSLSIALQHFFPVAGNLIVFPNPSAERKPEIRHLEGDSVAVSFAECTLDFNNITSNQPRHCNMFYPLIPPLGRATKVSDYVTIPLFAVRVTLFPNSGISIGLTNHHIAFDGTARSNFLRAWCSINTHGTDELFLASASLPVYDRLIKYDSSIDEACLSLPKVQVLDAEYQPPQFDIHTDKVRATVILTHAHISCLKKWISTQLPTLEYISSFSMACSYTWSCIAKSRANLELKKGDNDLEIFRCPVDWRSRLDPPVPETYFGNCVWLCYTKATKSTLLASDKGFLIAAESFGKALSEMAKKKKNEVIIDAHADLTNPTDPLPAIGVAGTPKSKNYDLDFGWGKPKKIEAISIDTFGAISTNPGKESSVYIEIGVSLPPTQMDAFITIFNNELESICSLQE